MSETNEASPAEGDLERLVMRLLTNGEQYEIKCKIEARVKS